MKKTDLYKSEARKIDGRMKQSATPARFGDQAAAPLDRREQRKLDQARGLVPFAVKLDRELVAALRERAQSRGTALDGLVAELLRQALNS